MGMEGVEPSTPRASAVCSPAELHPLQQRKRKLAFKCLEEKNFAFNILGDSLCIIIYIYKRSSIMEEPDIYEILKIILGKIRRERILWRLEGSANLKLQGVSVSVHDLDIATDAEGIAVFREALKEYIMKDSYRQDILSEALLLNIFGFEVEILNRKPDQKGLNMFDKIKKITWRALTIPALPLPDALEFYRKIEKEEKVKLIEEFLKKASWT